MAYQRGFPNTPDDNARDDDDIVTFFGPGAKPKSGDDSSAGSGVNVQDGTEGKDKLKGNDGEDIFNGLGGNDTLMGEGGEDNLSGDEGDDELNGGEGDDALDGGEGDDTLSGGEGDDELDGGADNDVLNGGDGDDKLNGGSGHDELNGGKGNDELDGGGDNDTLTGGEGDDVFKFDPENGGASEIDDMDVYGYDTIHFSGMSRDDITLRSNGDGGAIFLVGELRVEVGGASDLDFGYNETMFGVDFFIMY